ncbi:MAG: hypothetical protein ABR583_08215 [Gaiellaceae bacterium]
MEEALSAARRRRMHVRLAVVSGLAVALAAYYAGAASLRELPTWWDVAFLAFLLMPAVFGLVYLALPARRARGLALLAVSFGVLAAIFEVAGLEAIANFAKLGAMTALAFWFLEFFERLWWVALVAALIPWIDSLSVWRGPTRHIVTEQREVFTTLSFAFPVPGEDASANLGLPDLLFFALFLAAAVRWRLRPGWTWLAMTLSFGATMALAVAWDVGGLPALPGIALAFLAVNADLIWRDLKGRRAEVGSAPPAGAPE